MSVALSTRLRRLASGVPEGASLVDVGTDHAWLPIYLLQQGRIASAIATDIAAGPFASALHNVRTHGLGERISVRMGAGLQSLQPGEADTVVIAGMGGHTIRVVLDESPDVLSEMTRLILQPMNASRQVREWLFSSDFCLVDEGVVAEEGRLYEYLIADRADVAAPIDAGAATVPPRATPGAQSFDPYRGNTDTLDLAFEFGPVALARPDAAMLQHVQATLARWTRICASLQRGQPDRMASRSVALARRIAAAEVWLAQQQGGGAS